MRAGSSSKGGLGGRPGGSSDSRACRILLPVAYLAASLLLGILIGTYMPLLGGGGMEDARSPRPWPEVWTRQQQQQQQNGSGRGGAGGRLPDGPAVLGGPADWAQLRQRLFCEDAHPVHLPGQWVGPQTNQTQKVCFAPMRSFVCKVQATVARASSAAAQPERKITLITHITFIGWSTD